MGCSNLKLVVEIVIAVALLMRDIICCKTHGACYISNVGYAAVLTDIKVTMFQEEPVAFSA
jgi:hypothetical protein